MKLKVSRLYIENIQERANQEIKVGFQEEARESAPEDSMDSFRLALLYPVTPAE